MKKKTPDYRQFKIDMGLSNEIDMLREGFHVRTSRAAFAELLLRKGIQAEKTDQAFARRLTDSGESAFKK